LALFWPPGVPQEYPMDIQSPKSEPMFFRSSFLVGRGKPHIAHNILLRANSFGGPSALLVHEFKVCCGVVLRGSWVNKSSISSLPKVAPKESCKFMWDPGTEPTNGVGCRYKKTNTVVQHTMNTPSRAGGHWWGISICIERERE